MTAEFKYKLVVAVRKDIPLSKGKLAAQVAHAAVACVLDCRKKRSKFLTLWLNEGQRKIVVETENLETLRNLEMVARRRGLVSCIIEDAGLTEVEPGTVTCIGIGPGPSNLLDEVTGRLPLL